MIGPQENPHELTHTMTRRAPGVIADGWNNGDSHQFKSFT
jgi:hypothetical protein